MTAPTLPVTEQRFDQLLHELADDLGDPAHDTLLYENRGRHLVELELISRHVSPGGSVVDIGGGLGINALCLARLGASLRLAVVDRYDEYREGNRMGTPDSPMRLMKASGVEAVTQDFWIDRRLPWDNGSFDVVTIFDVLEHLPGSPLPVLEEAKRLVRPGGTLILGGPNATALMRRVRLLVGQHPYMPFEPWVSGEYYSHFREFTAAEYVQLVERVGFETLATDLDVEPSRTRALSRYHNRRHPITSPVAWALLAVYGVEKLFPRLRPVVYVIARRGEDGEA